MLDLSEEPICPACQQRLPGRENDLLNEWLIDSPSRTQKWHARAHQALLDARGDVARATASLAAQLWTETWVATLPLRGASKVLARAALDRIDWPLAAAAWIPEDFGDEDAR